MCLFTQATASLCDLLHFVVRIGETERISRNREEVQRHRDREADKSGEREIRTERQRQREKVRQRDIHTRGTDLEMLS